MEQQKEEQHFSFLWSTMNNICSLCINLYPEFGNMGVFPVLFDLLVPESWKDANLIGAMCS